MTVLSADERKDGATITIEGNVLMASGIHMYVNKHRFDDKNIPISQQGHYPGEDIVVKKGSWIGANVVILSGVTIGTNSVVGAGSVVTKDVPNNSVVDGVPAKIIRKI